MFHLNVSLLLVLLQDEWQQPWMESWGEQGWVCMVCKLPQKWREVNSKPETIFDNFTTQRIKEELQKNRHKRKRLGKCFKVVKIKLLLPTLWLLETIKIPLHLSDWVVMLSWGWHPASSSPLGQWRIPSQRCPASMQPPGGGQENWPAGQLRGLVAVGDGCVPAGVE